MVRHLRVCLRDISVNLKYRKINVFEAFKGMLDCSSIPLFFANGCVSKWVLIYGFHFL
jgi:hypothetical protein